MRSVIVPFSFFVIKLGLFDNLIIPLSSIIEVLISFLYIGGSRINCVNCKDYWGKVRVLFQA